MPGARCVNADTFVDDFAIINTGATVDHDCSIGTWSHVGPGVNLAGEVHIGQGAFIGTGASVIPKPGLAIGRWWAPALLSFAICRRKRFLRACPREN